MFEHISITLPDYTVCLIYERHADWQQQVLDLTSREKVGNNLDIVRSITLDAVKGISMVGKSDKRERLMLHVTPRGAVEQNTSPPYTFVDCNHMANANDTPPPMPMLKRRRLHYDSGNEQPEQQEACRPRFERISLEMSSHKLDLCYIAPVPSESFIYNRKPTGAGSPLKMARETDLLVTEGLTFAEKNRENVALVMKIKPCD